MSDQAEGGASRAEDPGRAAGSPGRRDRVVAGALLAGALVAYAALIHHGVGPDLAGEDGRWFEPRGFLRRSLAGLGDGRAIALLGAVATLGLAAVVWLTRSALARAVALWAAVAVVCFAAYGLALPLPWQAFGGHWSGTMLVFAAVVGGALAAVWLTGSWLRLPLWLRVATYLPVFAAVVALERNITGTDPALPFALSPWPMVTVFGLEVVASIVAWALVGVAAALVLGLAPEGSRRRRLAPWAGALLAAAVPMVAVAVGSRQGLLPFAAGPTTFAVVAGGSLALFAAAVLPLLRRPERAPARARLFVWAAALLGLPLLLGQTLTRLDYAETRNDRAQRVIEGLEAFYAAEQVYPDSLAEVVEAGHLEELPRPRIGFPFLANDAFVYQSFGTSFLLEFAAPRWIQCAYNPPYFDEDEREEAEDGDRAAGEDDLAGAWSCPSNPPELW